MVLINRGSDSSSAPLDQQPDNTVLANSPDSNRWSNHGKSRITEFYGFEGDDFRHFIHTMDSFFALNGITSDFRKVAILRSQLRRVAAVFFDKTIKEKGTSIQKITYQEAVQFLQERFVSEALIDVYQNAFEEMFQTKGESPSEYLSRLYEAADLGNITNESAIYSRFRAGLSRQIKVFCKEQASNSFQDWIKNANAWWNAHADRTIKLVDNPFNYSDEVNQRGSNLNLVTIKEGNRHMGVSTYDNNQKFKGAYAGVESPTIAELSAKLEALELHSLIPSANENGKVNGAMSHKCPHSLRSDDRNLRSFIKNIISQELSNNGKITHTFIRNLKSRGFNPEVLARNPYLDTDAVRHVAPPTYVHEDTSYVAPTNNGYDETPYYLEDVRRNRGRYAPRYPSRYRQNYDNDFSVNQEGHHNSYGNHPYNNGNQGYVHQGYNNGNQGYNGRRNYNYNNQGYNNDNSNNGNQGYQNGRQGYSNDNPNYNNQGYSNGRQGYNNYQNYNNHGNTGYAGKSNGNQTSNGNQYGSQGQPNNPSQGSGNVYNRYQNNSNDQGNHNGPPNNNQFGTKNSYQRKELNESKN